MDDDVEIGVDGEMVADGEVADTVRMRIGDEELEVARFFVADG